MGSHGGVVAECKVGPIVFKRGCMACGEPDRMAGLREPMRNGQSDIGARAEDQNGALFHSASLSDCAEAKAKPLSVSRRIVLKTIVRESEAASVAAVMRL